MPGIGVINNPRSRVNKRDPSRMRAIGYLLGSQGEAEATKTLDDLYRAAEVFKAERIDILGINGGDGTLHVTLTAFLQVYGDAPLPKIAILRGGTLNTIARSLGIFGRTEQILYDVIDRYHQGEPFQVTERHVMKVGDRYGFIFGNGLIANFLAAYYATGRPSPLTGALTLGRAIGSAMLGTRFTRDLFQRFRGAITVDGERWARPDFVTIAAASIADIGIGFRPFFRCLEKPGHFAVLGIHCAPLSLIWELPAIFRALPMRRHKAISAVSHEVRLEADEPFNYIIDGDCYRDAADLSLSTGPRLQFIVPQGV